MQKGIKNTIRKLGFNIEHYSVENKKIFGSYIPLKSEFTYDKEKGIIQLHALQLQVNIKQHDFFLKSLRFVKDLTAQCKAQFWVNDKDELFATIRGITISLQTGQDVSTLHEIFVKDCYNYQTTADFILIDIGLNVGITSLFFSVNPLCKHIFSFEPFEETYRQAMYNLSLNDNAVKINPFNYGLGAEERIEDVDYIPAYRGSMGINGIPSFIQNREGIYHTNIQIHNASKVLSPIIRDYKSENSIVVKIDCEGAEYEILKDLFQSGLLSQIDVVMMEWHNDGATILTQYLRECGFDIFSFYSSNPELGGVYAIRRNEKKK